MNEPVHVTNPLLKILFRMHKQADQNGKKQIAKLTCELSESITGKPKAKEATQ